MPRYCCSRVNLAKYVRSNCATSEVMILKIETAMVSFKGLSLFIQNEEKNIENHTGYPPKNQLFKPKVSSSRMETGNSSATQMLIQQLLAQNPQFLAQKPQDHKCQGGRFWSTFHTRTKVLQRYESGQFTSIYYLYELKKQVHLQAGFPNLKDSRFRSGGSWLGALVTMKSCPVPM